MSETQSPPPFLRLGLFVLFCLLAPVAVFGALLYYNSGLVAGAAIHLAGAGLYLALLVVWYRLHRNFRSLEVAGRRIFIAGLFLVMLPGLYYLASGAERAYDLVRLALFRSNVNIAGYSEEVIRWEGFDKPVGVRVQIQLEYPFALPGKLRHPRILVGGDTSSLDRSVAAYWEHCLEPLEKQVGCMSFPLWPMRPLPQLVTGGGAELVYELYPSNLYHMETPNRLCLRQDKPYNAVMPVTGGTPLAFWHVDVDGQLIDLGSLLTDALTEKSSLLGQGSSVENWFRALQSDSLLGAGYHNCPIPDAIRFDQASTCYCRESQEASSPAS